jgi:hypothetical protein
VTIRGTIIFIVVIRGTIILFLAIRGKIIFLLANPLYSFERGLPQKSGI